jgi:chemotaxis protein MotB
MNGGPGGEKKIIVVKKKVKGHGAHHGGSWKVAYADFVTAMMAFFLVMWIMGLDTGTKNMVQGYFSNPVGFQRAYSGGMNPTSQGDSPQNLGLRRAVLMSRQWQKERFESAARRIEERIDAEVDGRPGLNLQAAVEVVVTEEGLRIELMEAAEQGVFFSRSSARPEPILGRLLEIIGPELSLLPNLVVLEGHTDAVPFRAGRRDYGNWELSVDRANAARRILEGAGLSTERVVEVRGYADRNPRVYADPSHASNRRITILMPFVQEEDVRRVTPLDSLVPPAVELPPVAGSPAEGGTTSGELR